LIVITAIERGIDGSSPDHPPENAGARYHTRHCDPERAFLLRFFLVEGGYGIILSAFCALLFVSTLMPSQNGRYLFLSFFCLSSLAPLFAFLHLKDRFESRG
jgi:hypothetical protein